MIVCKCVCARMCVCVSLSVCVPACMCVCLYVCAYISSGYVWGCTVDFSLSYTISLLICQISILLYMHTYKCRCMYAYITCINYVHLNCDVQLYNHTFP